MRLFVAVNLPDEVRSQVWETTHGLRGQDLPIRWVSSDLLHITVKFLGDVAADRVMAIENRLRDSAQESRPHSISIQGMGAFPSLRKPQTLWAGCEPAPALELLQHGVEKRLAEIGFPVDGRPFRPHVTVGRVRRGTRPRVLDGFGRELERIELDAVALVSSMELMESRLGPAGPTYRVVRSFEFGPTKV